MAVRRQRADLMVVAQGLGSSRTIAQALIMAGQILESGSGRRIDKAGSLLPADTCLQRRGEPPPYVSRAGGKLAAALAHFSVDVGGRACVDVGASTGGFTDCLLQAGARHVYALDVGHNQLAWRLRQSAQVTCLERVNARLAPPDLLPERCQVAVVDVSFIALRQVLPATLAWLACDGDLIALVKPQFELEPPAVGSGGIVRDPAARARATASVVAWLAAQGLRCAPPLPSPVLGARGNQEFLVHARRQPVAPRAGGLPSPSAPGVGGEGPAGALARLAGPLPRSAAVSRPGDWPVLAPCIWPAAGTLARSDLAGPALTAGRKPAAVAVAPPVNVLPEIVR